MLEKSFKMLEFGLKTSRYACHQYLETVSVTCFYHYGIGEYSTVDFSVTLQSKF